MKLRVIFLDIDGVLRTRETYGKPYPTAACVKSLNRILTLTKAKIVVSSTWRAPRRLGWLRELFAGWGIHAAKSRTIGMTPELHKAALKVSVELYLATERGDEIQAWLDLHPDVSSFVILDDDDDMKHLKPYLVQSEFAHGLTDALADRAVEILMR